MKTEKDFTDNIFIGLALGTIMIATIIVALGVHV